MPLSGQHLVVCRLLPGRLGADPVLPAERQTVTQTVVSRNIAAGGLVVLTGASPPTGDGPAVLSVDNVEVQVTTTDLVNGSPYRFDVSASRRTPALRIYPVPDINLASAAQRLVNGTAPPGAQVSLTITDSSGKTIGRTSKVDQDRNDLVGTWTAATNRLDRPPGRPRDLQGRSPPATVMSARPRPRPTKTPRLRRQRSPSSTATECSDPHPAARVPGALHRTCSPHHRQSTIVYDTARQSGANKSTVDRGPIVSRRF